MCVLFGQSTCELKEFFFDMSTKIPFELLKGRENFDSWEIGVKAYLTIKDLWVWTGKKPDTAKPEEVSKDARAMGELTLLIDPQLYSYVANAVTTKDAWDGIVSAFQDNGTFQKIFTLVKFVTTKAEHFSTRQEYVNQMLTLWRKVRTAGFSIDEKTAGSLMLGSLPAEYRPMVMGIEKSGETITVDFVKNIILNDTLMCNENIGDESALKVVARGKNKNKKVQCYQCQGPHFRNRCPQLKKSSSKNEKEKALFCAYVAQERSNDWFIDSAATADMTYDEKQVGKILRSTKDHVLAADGKKMDIIGMGTVKKLTTTNKVLELNDVQVTPGICANLLSVAKLVLKNFEVIFNKNGCKIINGKGEVIATGRFENMLFKLNTQADCAYAVMKSDNIRLWHRRLGHVSLGNMSFLNLSVPSNIKCKICIKGKQARNAFTNVGTRANKKLELVHSDVCGPIQVNSLGGAKYFVSFIDDCTRKVFIYTLKNKNEVLKCLTDFKAFAEKQTENNMKMIRTDGGGEYVSKLFSDFCDKNGIIHQKTTPYTPQQNGVAERMNRTLLDRVRCMLLDSNLPRYFWAEALSTATRIVNFVPCKATGEKSPEYLWSNREPDLNTLKVFGCTAFAHIPSQKRKKLDDKGVECIFVGYSETSKAYRLYNKGKKNIIVSRDVNFIENDSDNLCASEENEDFFIEVQENYESGGGSDVSNSQISAVETPRDQEENDQEENVSVDGNDTSVSEAEQTVVEINTSEISVSDDSRSESFGSGLDDTMASILDDTARDPTYTSTATVDPSASRPITRSNSSNPSNILNSAHIAFCVALCTETPVTVNEALQCDESEKWLDAMKEELNSMHTNNTWDLVNLPHDRKAIKNKWVFARKTNQLGHVTKYKARLVAKGFSQREGIDYTQTFSPVARYQSLRYLLCLVANLDLNLTQMDAVSAFLNGPLSEEVYMEQPPHFNDNSNRVCKLKRSIYGLKQSGRNWNILLNATLIDFGLKRLTCDQCIYVSRNNNKIMIIMIWVDDVLIACNDDDDEKKLRAALENRFKMKYLGEASVILGINITRDRKKRTVSIDQSKYIVQLLEKFGMAESHPVNTPMDVNTRYSKNMIDEEEKPRLNFPYREAIGSLLFAAQVTRPDINFPVILLSRYAEEPKWAHWMATKRIMRYLRGSINKKLTYGEKTHEILGYCDSDYAGDIDDRKSTSGYVFIKNGAAISWQTKKQAVVAQSTAEAEYTSLALAVKEALWFGMFEHEIFGTDIKAVQLFCDNKGAVDLAYNNNVSDKTKHIDIKLKFVHDELEKKKIALSHVSTNDMLADVLTKSLTKEKHQNCIIGFGLK